MPKFLIIGTPIGNLDDMTLRAIKSLGLCDALLCEDTRRTGILLKHFGIGHKKLIRFDRFKENAGFSELINSLSEYSHVGLVSDAGMPGICDPGGLLVSYLQENNIEYEIIPGVSSLTTAIAGFGLTLSEFYFGGFLPRKKSEITRLLETLAKLKLQSVFFESPNRLDDTLLVIGENYPGVRVVVARELTKIHEQFITGKAANILKTLTDNMQLRGEVVLFVDFSGLEDEVTDNTGIENTDILSGYDPALTKRENAKVIAKKYGLNSSDVYRVLTEKVRD